ncbi:MAG: HNH endonuclease [Verrucomicrobiia bacterium]|jgi:hypothetical protein
MSKQELYNIGREALRKLTGGEDVGYVCPVCLNNFLELQDLSEEHVPPDSVGGKVLCLTCRKCNSEAGYQIDAHVHREQLSHSFMEKNGQTRRATLIKGEIQLNVDVRNDQKGIQIQILGEHNDPKVVEKSDSQILVDGTSFQLRDEVSYSRKMADVGYLKSAYLAAFAKLGYAYVLMHGLDRVRQQIRSPQSQLLEVFRLDAGSGDEIEKALLLFQRPIHCLGVKMGKSIVCLPPPPPPFDRDGFYEKLQEMRSASPGETWQIDGMIHWPERFELALDFCGKYRIEVQRHFPADATRQGD